MPLREHVLRTACGNARHRSVTTSNVAAAGYIALVLLVLMVNVLKGKWKMLFVAPFLGIALLVTAIRLAKPRSWWARNRYDAAKLAKTEERFAPKRYPIRPPLDPPAA